MDAGEVQKRLRAALAAARRDAAARRVRSDDAARHYDAFLETHAVPVFRHVAAALTGEGHPFKVMTPSGAVRISPERSPDEFIELVLDASYDPPQVVVHVVRGRGRRTFETETPLRDRTPIQDLTGEQVLEALLREVVPFVQR
jgi:hypothetical protein